jgi:hypothetical protein
MDCVTPAREQVKPQCWHQSKDKVKTNLVKPDSPRQVQMHRAGALTTDPLGREEGWGFRNRTSFERGVTTQKDVKDHSCAPHVRLRSVSIPQHLRGLVYERADFLCVQVACTQEDKAALYRGKIVSCAKVIMVGTRHPGQLTAWALRTEHPKANEYSSRKNSSEKTPSRKAHA